MRYRYYFIEAFILTCAIFAVGFFIGWNIEQSRNNELTNLYYSTEDELLDLGTQMSMTNLGKFTCSELIERSFIIGDRIYEQALIFDDYESAAIFTKSQLIKEHRKFDTLRTLYWISNIKIKERCGENAFITLVYLYDYPTKNNEEVSKQRVMSKVGLEVKQSLDGKTILIPIAKNLNISSLDDILSKYNLFNESAILIVNEERVFLANETDDIRSYLGIENE